MGIMSFVKILIVLGLICSRALTSPVDNAATTTVSKPLELHTCNTSAPHDRGEVSTKDAGTRRDNVWKRTGDRDSYQWHRKCPQLGPLIPENTDSLLRMEMHLASRKFLQDSAKRLSAAVRIETTSRDGMQELPGDDPRWDMMRPFARNLEKDFPLVHQYLKLEKINTHGLVYTWNGTDESLDPCLLMAHQDAVPVEPGTERDWKYLPFSGHWDGKYVWGRGAIDNKSNLIAYMEAVEALLGAGFWPNRTVILAFGFDEEISGSQGAKQIAQHLLQRYSKRGIAAIIDEGSGVLRSWWGSEAAFVGVAEKGYLDIEISVHMPSGHSSLPPEDNSITVMAELIRVLKANKFDTELSGSNPITQTMFCAAQNDARMPDLHWEEVARADRGELTLQSLAEELIAYRPRAAGFFQTTQSIGTIRGGSKVNVVPGTTTLRVNHRVNHGSTTEDVKRRLETIVREYAESHRPNGQSIILDAWGGKAKASSQTISLKVLPGWIEPSRVTPYHLGKVGGETPFSILQGTTIAQYGTKLAYVAPLLLPANTDSRHYALLSDNIFRFSPGRDTSDPSDDITGEHGAHRVNERRNMVAHINAVQWNVRFIRNMDRAFLD